jgi:hypothetical protein
MALADNRAGWPEMALWIATNQELGQLDWDGLTCCLSFRKDNQTQLHVMSSFLMMHVLLVAQAQTSRLFGDMGPAFPERLGFWQ